MCVPSPGGRRTGRNLSPYLTDRGTFALPAMYVLFFPFHENGATNSQLWAFLLHLKAYLGAVLLSAHKNAPVSFRASQNSTVSAHYSSLARLTIIVMIIIIIIIIMCECRYMCVTAHVWRSENNCEKSFVSFYLHEAGSILFLPYNVLQVSW